VVTKALVCRLAMPAHAGGVTSDRSNGQREQSHARSRTYEATQAPWLLGSRSPSRGAGNAGNLGRRRRWSRSPRPAIHARGGDMGVLELSHRGGEHGTTGSAQALVNRLRALHSAVLGPCCPEKQFAGLLPSTEAARQPSAPSSPRKRRRPRKGYAERVVRRHGFLASSHDRTRMPVVPVPDGGLPPHQTSGSRAGRKRPERVNEAADPSSEGSGRRKPTPNADRGGSLARRRIHGSRACPRVEHALQKSVGSRKPTEARLKPPRT